MKSIVKIAATFLSTSLLCGSVFAYEARSADERYVYVGFEGGIVEPVVKKFKHKGSGTNIRLKKSVMYSGKLGYSFYPQLAVELSGTYSPKYKLHYVLPTRFGDIPGDTRVGANVYMANIVYDFMPGPVTPFVILGAGLAKVTVKGTESKALGLNIFRVNKTTTNAFAWQAGLGASYNVTDNFSVDACAKLQVVNNIRIKYDRINLATRLLESQSPIKKTIGTAEFGLGFTFKLPV